MPKTIVILGAGFTGLTAAKKIKKELQDAAEVIVIDPKDHFLFTPRLIDALQHGKDDSHEFAWIQTLVERHHFKHIKARATLVRREKNIVMYEDEKTHQAMEQPFDILVICTGARPTYYNIPGAQEHSIPLKTKNDVVRIHERMQQAAEERKESTRRVKDISLVVVGAGASGIEALFAMKEFSRYPLSCTLLQGAPEILPGFPTRIVQGTMKELRKHGVHIHLGDPVIRVDDQSVETAHGRRIPADLVLWSAGIEPNAVPLEPPAEQDRAGCLVVDRFLRVDESIFAAGDAVVYREHNVTIPKNAQTAMLMGNHLATNVIRAITNHPLKPFHYRSKGSILMLGKTGFLDLRIVHIKTRFTGFLRNILYTIRYWQIAGF